MDFFRSIYNNQSLKVLMIFIVLDVIMGILRAIKEKKLNSCIGIDGVIRKTAMIICVLFLSLVDYIVKINFIGFIPEMLRTELGLGSIGISSLFIIIFIIFEILSVLKNMILCKLPIPQKLQNTLENILDEFTTENKNNKEDK